MRTPKFPSFIAGINHCFQKKLLSTQIPTFFTPSLFRCLRLFVLLSVFPPPPLKNNISNISVSQ